MEDLKESLFSYHPNCSHPSFEVVVYLFLLLKVWQSFILWSALCCFHSFYHCCHSLALIVIFCHVLSLVVSLAVTRCTPRCRSLSFVVTRCTTLCHSLSFVVTRCTTRCHSLPLVVPLVTRCHSLSLVVIRCHSLSLDVPLVCLFINDHFLSVNDTMKQLCIFFYDCLIAKILWNQLKYTLWNNLFFPIVRHRVPSLKFGT